MSVEKTIARLFTRYDLAKIELLTQNGKKFTARAIPSSSSKIVSDRTQLAFTDAARKRGSTSFSAAEADEIRRRCLEEPLAVAVRGDIATAIEVLAVELAEIGKRS